MLEAGRQSYGDEAAHERRVWLHACDRDLLAWFCTKYAKDTFLSYFSHGRSSVICLYQQYKANLKNLGKGNFDCKSTKHESVEIFFTWCLQNDADIYLRDHYPEMAAAYTLHKRKLYAKYKIPTCATEPIVSHVEKVPSLCPRGKQRLMARDAVYHVKCVLMM
jgi:hypothetical protein